MANPINRANSSRHGARGSAQTLPVSNLSLRIHAILLSLLLLLPLLDPVCAMAQTNYTKSAEVPPLRTSFTQLQVVLSKASALTAAANAGASVRREELALKAGVVTVSLPGHNLVQTSARVPERIEGMTYSYSALDPARISRISIDLADYRRVVTVEGQSPEQVDAVFAVIREDLQAISTPLGGTGIRSLGFPAIWFLLTVIGWCGATWYSKRTPVSLAISLSAALLVFMLVVLPFDELLSGFWAVSGEPSFMVRYGPHMSFVGFLIAVVGVPLMVLQLFPIQTRQRSTASNSDGNTPT
jgi:hypothetical protein